MWLALQHWRDGLWCAAAMTPGVVGIAALNAHLYGSPLQSGYGSTANLYAVGNLLPNLRQYGSWYFDVETPIVVLAAVFFVAPAFVGTCRAARPRVLLGGMIATVLCSYLFYFQFDSWTYLRFFLPIWPIVMVLTAASALALIRRLPPRAAPFVTALCVAIAGWEAMTAAVDRNVFRVGRSERAYGDVARYVADHTEPEAVLISMQHSGLLRLYTGRRILRYDVLDPEWLDRAVEFLVATNRHPYIVVEQWELDRFTSRFKDSNRLGALDWNPIADLSGKVFVFDAARPDRALPPHAIPSPADDFWHIHLPRAPQAQRAKTGQPGRSSP